MDWEKKLADLREKLGLADNASFDVIKAAMATLEEDDQLDEKQLTELQKFMAEDGAEDRIMLAVAKAITPAMEAMGSAVNGIQSIAEEMAKATKEKAERVGEFDTEGQTEEVRSFISGGSPYDEWEKSHYALAYTLQMAMHEYKPRDVERPSEKLINAVKFKYPEHAKAMDTAETGYGLELVAAETVATLWRKARLQSNIAPLFNFIPMPAETTYVPIDGGLPEFLYYGEATANNESNFTTGKTGSNRVTLAAKKLIAHQMWSGEMEEDSVLPFVPFLQDQLSLAVAYYIDSLLLNGDTTNAATGNINLDDADPADTKHYLALDGLRHLPLVTTTGNGLDVSGSVAASDFMTLRSYMGVWGTNPAQIAYIVDMSTYAKLIDLDEVVTLDKMGPGATILQGQLGLIFGSPIIVSEAMSLTEADGKVSTTSANNTKGQIVAVNRTGWLGGWRRNLKIEFERIPATDQSRLVASLRVAFNYWEAETAAAGYNITV